MEYITTPTYIKLHIYASFIFIENITYFLDIVFH